MESRDVPYTCANLCKIDFHHIIIRSVLGDYYSNKHIHIVGPNLNKPQGVHRKKSPYTGLFYFDNVSWTPPLQASKNGNKSCVLG